MIHMFIDHVDNAYRNLRRNRGRTLLTTLGITIGVASVTCILAISAGVTQMISGQIGSTSDRLIVVRPSVRTNDPNIFANPVSQQSFSTSTLDDADIAGIKSISNVEATVPIMTMTGTLKSANGTVKNNIILATSKDITKVANISMKSGQFFDDSSHDATAVVGEQLAIDLFDTDQAVGQVVTVRGQDLTIVGVMRNADDPINYNNVDLNQALVVNYERGVLFHDGRPQIQQIDILVDKPAQLKTAKMSIKNELLDTHQGEEDFTVISGAAISKPSNQLFSALTSVMTAIATISLIVGGIGVMNILLVGVAESTREIGIRKALGASNGTIVAQFLTESLMMCLLGGLIGYGLGFVAAFVISTFLYFAPAFTWLSAAVAFGMVFAVGIVFGLFPAIRAARKNTIEALRQYH